MKNEIWIDGDILLHRATSAVQKEFKFAGPEPAITADFAEAVKIIDREILVLRRTLDAGSVVIALSDPDSSANWRKKVLPSYKQERVTRAKPILFKKGRAELESRFETKWHPGLEGDDVLGIGATTPGHPERVVVSIDKDLQGVPCRLYNPNHADWGIIEQSEEEANYFHLMQALMGDRTDGYFGIQGVGPKKAEAILDSEVPKGMSPWERVCAAYRHEGLTEFDALTQARVAFILRHGYWSKDVGVKLWSPPDAA